MASSRLAAAVCCYAVVLTTLVGATIPQGETLLEVAKEWHGLDANSPTYVQYFSSWVAGTDPCVSLWVGTNCSSAGDVEGLNLTQAGLHGPVPAAMSRLTSLKLLDLSNGPIERYYNSNNNFITGDLAPLGSLTNLMYLNMGRNVLGLKVFPEAVKNLTNIRTLLIDNTRIEGPFPDLSNLTKLEKLFVGNNSMTGPFPRSLTQITSLRELTLWYNNLTDVLPAELSNLGNLTYFNCNRCKLFGGLPPELGKLTKMKRFHLYKNDMSGRIPREYSAWKSLTELRLELNYFHGSFSPEFFKLVNLTKLILNNMQLYGSLPGDLTNNTVPNLKELAMSCNYFTGATPKLTNGVIPGDGQTIPSLAYNCFDNTPVEEIGQDTRCARKLTCIPFQEALQKNGCPDCPPAQRISNTTTCVCMPGGDGKLEPWVAPVIGLSAALAVLIIILLVIVFLTSCFRHKPFDKTRDIFGKKLVEEHYDPNWKVPAGLKAFTLAELSHMTKDFSESQVVGQGGFGKVYRGVAPDGKEVAIKRSSASASSHENTQGMQEFRNEIDLLSRLHHRNLVKLEGFCDEEGMQILVYEYMRHGNLHLILFRDDLLHYMDWYKRLEIAVETAQGLEYLHHHADPSVIHRDVKPGNILLNEYLQAKVADFGISRESAEFDTHVSTKLAGTAGYFDPQYFLHRQLTKASDVYSYGVCLLELVTGQKAIDHERGQESNLIEWAKPRLNKLGVDSIVDPRLHGDYPPSVFLDMANLAITCSLFDKNERPTMREVVAVLEPQLKAATRPPQWALPLRPIPELTWRGKERGPGAASSSTTENLSHGLRKSQAEDQLPLTDASTNSTSFTTVHVDPR